MAYSYKLLPKAKADLDDAVAWYVEKGMPTAQKFIGSYQKLTKRITDNPLQFPKIRGEVRRAMFSRPFPYNIYFIFEGETVYAIAIFHTIRDPEEWKARV